MIDETGLWREPWPEISDDGLVVPGLYSIKGASCPCEAASVRRCVRVGEGWIDIGHPECCWRCNCPVGESNDLGLCDDCLLRLRKAAS